MDCERRHFSVSPCVWNADATEHVVPILGVNTTSNSTSTNGGNKDNGSKCLSGGATAGIVIGVVVLLIVVVGVWFFVIRPRQKKVAAKDDYTVDPPAYGAVETDGKGKVGMPELQGQNKFNHHEAEGDSVFVPGSSTTGKAELHAPRSGAAIPAVPELGTPREEMSEMLGTQVDEIPGSDVPEMMVESSRPSASVNEGTKEEKEALTLNRCDDA